MKIVIRTTTEIEIVYDERPGEPTPGAAGEALTGNDVTGTLAANQSCGGVESRDTGLDGQVPERPVMGGHGGSDTGSAAGVEKSDCSAVGSIPVIQPRTGSPGATNGGVVANTLPSAGVAPGPHDTVLPEGPSGQTGGDSIHANTGGSHVDHQDGQPSESQTLESPAAGEKAVASAGDDHALTVEADEARTAHPPTVLADPTVAELLADIRARVETAVANPPPPVEPPAELDFRRPVEEHTLDIPAFLDRRGRAA